MKAYKFRTAETFEFVVDILVNRRLYCSEARSLNDIREGDIRVGNDRGRELEVMEFGQKVTDALGSYRVCSLTKTFNNHLLWAYYAGGYTGLAVEVDLPSADVSHMSYDDDFLYLSDYLESGDLEATVRSVLSRKYKVWSHEEEVRVIATAPFYGLSRPIARIIVGPRMSQAMLCALSPLCSQLDIKMERAVVADWGIYTVGVQPMALPKPAGA